MSLLFGACTGGLDTGSSEGLATTTGPPSSIASSEPTTTTEPPPTGTPKALVLANGIVVPVLAELPESYSIHTPCGLPDTVARDAGATELYSADIVLDPGHGGEIETGAVGPNGLEEKDLNLNVAFATQLLLEELGYRVVVTRTADYRVPLVIRAEIANRLRPEVFVSIHHNAPNANPSTVPGSEMFVQSGVEESRRLGGLIYQRTVEALQPLDLDWVAATDAGTLSVINSSGGDAYSMVRRPDMPAVLAEFGYISNAPEAEMMAGEEYVGLISEALAGAIDEWFTTDGAGSGHVREPRVFDPNGLTGGSEGCVDPDLNKE